MTCVRGTLAALVLLAIFTAGTAILATLLLVAGVIWLLGAWVPQPQRRVRSASYRPSESLFGRRDQVANRILDLEDRVLLAESPEAREHFRTATRQYVNAHADLESGRRRRRTDTDLRRAQWELDATEAILEGRTLPPRSEHQSESVLHTYHRQLRQAPTCGCWSGRGFQNLRSDQPRY